MNKELLLKTKKTCSIMPCGNVHYAKGYCQKHYVRVKKYNDPSKGDRVNKLNSDGETATIFLTQGYEAIIDAVDFEIVGAFKWKAEIARTGAVYARRYVKSKGRITTLLLHRALMDAPPSLMVDHKNLDSLDNRRCNLRLATNSQNQQNKKPVSASGYKGVGKNNRPKNKPFKACIIFDRKNIHLGCFPTAEEAAHAYDKKAMELFGEFACLNFPQKEAINE